MSKQRLELTWYNKDMALIPTEVGKYDYTWVDPTDPRYCETHTLVMDDYVKGVQTPKNDESQYSERADLPLQEDNLLILGESGDVLEALTRVPELADKYIGKVKLIYIDPPFNTGEVFDDYEDNLEHSIWLTMMRDRLLHMHKLLSNDGSIWIHLDHMENHRMRILIDEIFGATNFIGEVSWEKTYSPRNDAKGLSERTDVILAYRKSEAFVPNRLARTAAMDGRYKNPDNDPRGAWKNDNPSASGAASHQGMVFAIEHPITGELLYPPRGNHWRWSQERLLEIMLGWSTQYVLRDIGDEQLRARLCGIPIDEVRPSVKAIVVNGNREKSQAQARQIYNDGPWPTYYPSKGGTGGLNRKSYLADVAGRTPEDLWMYEEVGHTDGAKKEIQALFPEINAFSTPKPERLLERIIHIGSNPGDIVLDVFAGSGTTAAVAQKMGRRWVTGELNEGTFNTFTRPRLEKVINDQDPGGITKTKGERIPADNVVLPNGISPEQAADFTATLNKLISRDPELKKNPAIKALKAAAKTTRTKEIINWRGGGGFQVAHLSPACFDVDEELNTVILTEAATGQTLIESVAANLGFYLLHPDDDAFFEGRKGRTLLKVYEGIVTESNITAWLSELQEGESLIIAALGITDGVNQALRRHGKGCKAIVIPDDLFHYETNEEE